MINNIFSPHKYYKKKNDNEKMEWTENRETFIKLGYIFSIVSFFIFPVILGIAGFILGIFNF
jgi:hypothetical protein